jgi:hypothetical protein
MQKEGAERAFDDAEPLEPADELTADEQAAFERMQSETPMPTKDEGEEPPAGDEDAGGKQRPKQKADAGDGEADDDEQVDEVTIDAQGKAHDASGKYVPKEAFDRVRNRNKADREALAALQQENAKAIGRLTVLTELLNGIGSDPAKAPAGGDKKGDQLPTNPFEEADIDENEDVMGALQQQKRRNAYLHKQMSDRNTRDQVNSEVHAVTTEYVTEARRMAAEHVKSGQLVEVNGEKVSAYHGAYLHLVNMQHGILEAQGFTDENVRNRMIRESELQIVANAKKAGANPAQVIFNMALKSGFQMPAKQEGGEKKPAQKTEAQKKAEEHIERVENGLKASQSLTGKGGGSYSGLTAKQVLTMDDDAFAAYVDKLGGDDEFMRRFGGA